MHKVLIVDDEIDLLAVMKLLLTRQGLEVTTVSDGSKAIDAVSDFKPDVVILDVYIAGIDGRAICRSLKSNGSSKHIPVIMFSANNKLEDIISECNADEFISKPFEIENLMDKIRAYLPQRN